MSQFHIKDDGNPGRCKAAAGNCPFGESAPHFDSSEDARKFYESSRGSIFSTPKDSGYWVTDPFTGENTSFNKNQFGFDRKTIEAFTEGDCWRLAFDLHEKLKYPVFIITDLESSLGDRPSMYFGHMFVQNPVTGKFLDVNGEHTEDELLMSDWGVDDGIPVFVDVTDDLNIDQTDFVAFPNFDESAIGDRIIDQLKLKPSKYTEA